MTNCPAHSTRVTTVVIGVSTTICPVTGTGSITISAPSTSATSLATGNGNNAGSDYTTAYLTYTTVVPCTNSNGAAIPGSSTTTVLTVTIPPGSTPTGGLAPGFDNKSSSGSGNGNGSVVSPGLGSSSGEDVTVSATTVAAPSAPVKNESPPYPSNGGAGAGSSGTASGTGAPQPASSGFVTVSTGGRVERFSLAGAVVMLLMALL